MANSELRRLHSALKLRLTSELVGALGTGSGGNQSRARGEVALLSIECRHVVSEVSEVTFGELQVSPKSKVWPAKSASSTGEPDEEGGEQQRWMRRKERRQTGAASGEPVVYRTSDNQVVVRATRPRWQPALEREHFVRMARAGRTSGADSCALGALGLDADEPIILESDERVNSSSSAADLRENWTEVDGEEAAAEQREANWWLRLNCSTLGSVLSANGREEEEEAEEVGERQLRRRSQWSSVFCNDTQQVRRSLISGKPPPPPPQQQQSRTLGSGRQRGGARPGPHQAPLLVAYLALAEEPPANRRAHEQAVASAAAAAARRRTLAAAAADSSAERRQIVAQPPPPPLLEWFINNQEVSSAMLLPLVVVVVATFARIQFGAGKHNSICGARSKARALTSITRHNGQHPVINGADCLWAARTTCAWPAWLRWPRNCSRHRTLISDDAAAAALICAPLAELAQLPAL